MKFQLDLPLTYDDLEPFHEKAEYERGVSGDDNPQGAVVVARPGREVSADEIIGFCRERLTRFKCPTSVEFLEALPKSGTGKVQKNVLRRRSGGGCWCPSLVGRAAMRYGRGAVRRSSGKGTFVARSRASDRRHLAANLQRGQHKGLE